MTEKTETAQESKDTPAVPVETEIEETQETAADDSAEDTAESAEEAADVETDESDEAQARHRLESSKQRRMPWKRALAYGVLPGLALLLALAAGFLKWEYDSATDSRTAAADSIKAAKDSTIALLSYQPDKVDQQLGAARDRLTGEFRDSYSALVNDVVIPGSKQKQIAALASVPAAASVSADPKHAVVLIFVDQTVTVGQDAPTSTASSVRVTMDKVGGRWLISKFDPV